MQERRKHCVTVTSVSFRTSELKNLRVACICFFVSFYVCHVLWPFHNSVRSNFMVSHHAASRLFSPHVSSILAVQIQCSEPLFAKQTAAPAQLSIIRYIRLWSSNILNDSSISARRTRRERGKRRRKTFLSFASRKAENYQTAKVHEITVKRSKTKKQYEMRLAGALRKSFDYSCHSSFLLLSFSLF